MSDHDLHVLNLLFVFGSLPATVLLIINFTRDIKSARRESRALLSALIFLFGAFLVAIVANIWISFFFLTDNQNLAIRYAMLRTLFIDSTWFTVSWAMWLLRKKA